MLNIVIILNIISMIYKIVLILHISEIRGKMPLCKNGI